MNSSLRVRALDQSLALVRSVAKDYGITRVTGTTALDRIGIPVFASIRPGAARGSLCVSAGKGLVPEEAEMGAYMEAMELALCEFGRSSLRYQAVTVNQMLKTFNAPLTMADFAPLIGQHFDEGETLACTICEDTGTGSSVLVPSELVFSPFDENPFATKFGSSSVGLASGNSLLEASVHGLAELIEHDIASFSFVNDESRLVILDSAPESIAALVRRCNDAGFSLYLRYTPNVFGMPYFRATLFDNTDEAPLAVCAGYGLHPVRSIAAVRAITEAAQSRLTAIHGGRDDLTKRLDHWTTDMRHEEVSAVAALRAKESDASDCISFAQIEDNEEHITSLEAAWDFMIGALRSLRLTTVLRVGFTEASDNFQVVKMIVPGLEAFAPEHMRIGTRFHDYILSL
ncbi:YcaO-like family protein [Burkholderia sp. Ac-20344]|uniref:YcaO-like family protein n=1 Tax=Burkholderia sp. Ac-20344 TaxID=2703890 RepID=UPI00197CAA0F|nr:YcaO-like family protein [Burkholderia sp. Ac-20344]MBN3831908.1 hypothetical protein [Burkholderia sp. Ac-20344]